MPGSVRECQRFCVSFVCKILFVRHIMNSSRKILTLSNARQDVLCCVHTDACIHRHPYDFQFYQNAVRLFICSKTRLSAL